MEKEKLKSKLRIMEMQAKAEIQKSLQPAIDLGKGNNINIQNNNYVQYRQEDLVKILLNQNKPQEKVIDV
jgi:hypothetical protein